jgi:hypothetical protein
MIVDCVCAGKARAGKVRPLEINDEILKKAPGSKERYVKPPVCDESGDGRFVRQGTSLLNIAGEKTSQKESYMIREVRDGTRNFRRQRHLRMSLR